MVFKAASSIQAEGHKPTITRVRQKLGEGSITTIHKYLGEWKVQQLLSQETLSPVQLKAQLVEQLKINEKITLDLLSYSATTVAQSAEIEKLESRVLELETKLAERERASKETIDHLTLYNQSTKESFDKTITMLTEQLGAINTQAITKVQEVGHRYDEKIMEAKLELRESQELLRLQEVKWKKHIQELQK